MKTNRISLVTLAATDVARLAGFYKSIGWQPEHEADEVAFFNMGGSKFGLYDATKLAQDLNKSVADLGRGAMTLAVNYADKAQVDQAYEAAIAAGGTVLKRPEDVFWGGYSGTWADPDGHVWEYAYNPFWELDAEGNLKS